MLMEGRKVSRREFLKLAGFLGGAAVMTNYRTEIAGALTQAIAANQLIILDGQACEGCAVSILQGADPDLYTAVELGTQLDFLIPVSVETGQEAAAKIDEFIEGNKGLPRILAVEGSVSMGSDGLYQTYWDYRHNERRPFKDLLKEAAEAADVIVALGTTAAYGGIPRGRTPKYGHEARSTQYKIQGNVNPTGSVGVADALAAMGIDLSNKAVPAVVNLPGCPVHPDHFFITAVDLIFGHVPELDEYGRPKAFFGRIIHDQCHLRGFFDRGQFLESFNQFSGNLNDPFPTKTGQKGAGCLLKLGCRGPVTFKDCPSRQWNSHSLGVSWPNMAGVPCYGCANPEFPDGKTIGTYTPLTEIVSTLPKPPVYPTPIVDPKYAGSLSAVAGAAGVIGGVAYARADKKKKSPEKDKEVK